MIKINTLLRYPGGKSRAIKKIIEYFPKDLKEMCSPFFGGGAIELSISKKGVEVFGYDSFEELVNFWECALNKESNCKTANVLWNMFHPEEITKEWFYRWQKIFQNKEMDNYSPEMSAAAFYMINRCSFSGTTLSGGMSPKHPRYNNNAIKRFSNFKNENVTVKLLDFEESITKHKDIFKYCDPPYMIEHNLYGNKGDKHKYFNHERLMKVLKSCDNWILSYNDCEIIREWYKDYKIVELNFSYGMSKSKTELLILNIKE